MAVELRTLNAHEYTPKKKGGKTGEPLLSVICCANLAQFEYTWCGDGCFAAGLLRLDPRSVLLPSSNMLPHNGGITLEVLGGFILLPPCSPCDSSCSNKTELRRSGELQWWREGRCWCQECLMATTGQLRWDWSNSMWGFSVLRGIPSKVSSTSTWFVLPLMKMNQATSQVKGEGFQGLKQIENHETRWH